MRFLSMFMVLLGFAGACAPAFADEAAVQRAVEARFPGVKVESVVKTTYLGGLYEIQIGGEIIYTDEKVLHLVNGSIIDAQTRKNLTEIRQQKLSAIKFEDLPLELAFKQVRGNGKRSLAVFSDPNCPYCRNLDRQLIQLEDVTIYTFLYPILKQDSVDKTKAIWCSKDRAKAYYDWMLSNKAPMGPANCSVPIDKMLDLGQKLGVRATPTSFVMSGQRVMGARLAELNQALNDSAQK